METGMGVHCKFMFVASVGVTILLGVAAAHADGRVTLTYAYDSYGPTHKALIDELRSRVRGFFQNDSLPENRDGFFNSALVDLNGDNIDEILIVAYSGTWCGSSLECDASVYQFVEENWVYTGRIAAAFFADQFYVNIEDREDIGWRTLNNGKFRSCWVKNPPDKLLPSDEDQFFMPHISGQPGYFWSVSMDKECPDR